MFINRIVQKVSIIMFMLGLLCFSVGANDGKSWYIKRNNNGQQPVIASEFSFLENNNGYYVDKNVNNERKLIYLTFDAGYENGNIEKILDILKNHNAKGNFFILENLIKKNTSLVIRMSEEGHLVCNHTSTHRDMTKITDEKEFQTELFSLEKTYTELTGKELSKFYRPPEGRFTEENLKFAADAGYKTVLWSCAYADWDNNNQPLCSKAIELIRKNTHNGMIILLHPTSRTNAEILDCLLTEWEKEGYSFALLDELK